MEQHQQLTLQRGFLEWCLSEEEGYISVAARHARTQVFEETIFKYPGDLTGAIHWLSARRLTSNIYFCPTSLRQPRRVKGNISTSIVAWADLDFCEPEQLLVPPSCLIETSPRRWQAYWKFKVFQPATDIENLNKRIARHHRDEGCDQSGWDLTQLLRLPITLNHKYSPMPADIKVLHFDKSLTYELKDFNEYPLVEGSVISDTPPRPGLSETRTAEDVINALQGSATQRTWGLFEGIPTEDWSRHLWHLEQILYGSGLSPEDVYIVCRDAGCNKFKRDHPDNWEDLLWSDVWRAKVRYENPTVAIIEDTDPDEAPDYYVPQKQLLTSEERERVRLRHTIVEEYIEWAKTTGDAAPQYHEAGAFTILSTLLAGQVKLPTSFGTLLPNLWFMILGSSSITRKSSAMDLAIDLLTEIDSDCILATDGSIEGLMTGLSTRPGRASIFLRDEFSGLLEMMNKKEYMAGMQEALTKLYDGKYQKRILRKEQIEVRDPVLILLTGGIKNKIYSLLTQEHITSGFIPRFSFITANADLTRYQPLGPPTQVSLDLRDKLSTRLRDIYEHYSNNSNNNNSSNQLGFSQEWHARLSPEAWGRYNELEMLMVEIAVTSSIEDTLTPVMTRLALTGLKMAILIAAAERLDIPDLPVKGDNKGGGGQGEAPVVAVEEIDIIHAFYYIEMWKQYTYSVIQNAGKSAGEHELERIYKYVQGKAPVKRSKIMQQFRLRAREADSIFDTLQQRGLIRIEKRRGGGAEVVYPMYTRKESANT